MTVKAVAFVSKSGTGKTTLLEKVISRLKDRGYRVGAIKHDAHRFDIDRPGKDSYRLTAAGADTMVISSPEKLALVKRHAASPPVEDLLAAFFTDVDIVLTEGFKSSSLPKIEVHRRERSADLLCRGKGHDPMLLAVASDEPLDLDVPLLDIDDPDGVADFIEGNFLP
ncbi:MAG TPA: molybdopterin-guanine dinucleotide biosynthesis protein B [Candidatus Deferrimicrobium sp.]|nr:molybdopterin-guanine dinucleotide biosynthesis protein B [Candidatus Deferrimicrobium sp.]